MSNKNLNIQQWATVGSSSTPDGGYRKFYPKTGEYFWYTVSDDGTEKQIGLSIYPKNGLLSTPLGSGNQFGAQLDVVLGSGLTFSADAPGSSILVAGLTAGTLKSTGGATSGYILTAASNGDFDWKPFSFPGLSGSTNSIAKFTSTTTVGNSLLNDNGTNVYIGTLPSFVPSTFNVNGSASLLGNIYVADDYNHYIYYNNGISFETNEGLLVRHDSGSMDYIKTSFDSIDTYSFSVLNGTFFATIVGTSTPQYSFKGPNLDEFIVGNAIDNDSTIRLYGDVNVYQGISLQGSFQIADGSEGENKILFDGGSGQTIWRYFESGPGITVSGWTISLQSGNGLTYSGNSLVVNSGNGLTFSNGQINLNIGDGLTFSSGKVQTNNKYFTSTTPVGYTGTSSETILKNIRIDSNTVLKDDILEVEFRMWKSGTFSQWTPTIRVGTSSSILGLPVMTPTILYEAGDPKPQYVQVRRNLTVMSATNSTEFFPNISSVLTFTNDLSGFVASVSGPSYSPIDWTQTQYIQICSKMGTSSTVDTITASSVQVKIWRQ